MKYPFNEIESKWQSYWEDNHVHKTDFSKTENKLYTLVMFIYPSGAKLHCGHWYNYGPTDTWARFKKLKGFNVFEPMGYDAFGLPAENYAIKTGVHPQDSTLKNIEDIRSQLKVMGCMYDWEKEMATCFPEYYKWNQWLFLQLYKKGLAYRKNAPVNWCDSCQTVLANEQVSAAGTCERCESVVIQKNLTQWFFKITDYADQLLDGLDTIQWPEKTKLMQKNWIGRSKGAEIDFAVEGSDKKISVFTTRPDTLFGVTYVVVAPEHPLAAEITTEEYKKTVEEYKLAASKLTEIDRTSTVKEKTGVQTGAYAINPVNGERVPVWVADYALITYGTGCVMAVPAHDERDFEFATKFNLPIRKVILQPGTGENDALTAAYTDPGTMINSGEFNGIANEEAKTGITEFLSVKHMGKARINYRLRDWLISRQRYWGTPIPVVYCDDCGEVPVPEDQLPVELPYDVEFISRGKSPLALHEGFMNTTCPKCGKPAKREADTMDTFVDSSWYYFRFLNPKFTEGIFDNSVTDSWVPVDRYVGGAEHATMHLLYARFIHKFLRDIGLTKTDEPFTNLVHQGTITNQGAKMSKSRGNVVNPDIFIEKTGADVFRLYLMFMGPYEGGGDWTDTGIAGTERFVGRAYDLFNQFKDLAKTTTLKESFLLDELSDAEKSVYRKINQTIAKYEGELENFRFNTAIASLMELQNELQKNLAASRVEMQLYTLKRYAMLLAPVAPHFGEECNAILGYTTSLFQSPEWFTPDTLALAEDSVNYAVQVNGKLRATLPMAINTEETVVKQAAKADSRVSKYLDGKTIVKEIFVKNKILNIVVKD